MAVYDVNKTLNKVIFVKKIQKKLRNRNEWCWSRYRWLEGSSKNYLKCTTVDTNNY